LDVRTSKPEESDLLIQKLPSDIGIHRNPRKGTLNAPDVLLEELEFSGKTMVDEVFPDEFDLEETHERITDNTQELAKYGKPILSVGGDHSVSFPVIKALKQENPDMKLVWLDAHLDLKEKVDEHVSHDVVVRELLNYFDEDEIVFLGITRRDADEEEFLENHELEIHGAEEAVEVSEQISGDIYLSLDIDVLREDRASGTGYPDGEMDMKQVKRVIQNLDVSHADLVEVAPPFDNGETVENARELLLELEEQLTG
jgi:agmatinase